MNAFLNRWFGAKRLMVATLAALVLLASAVFFSGYWQQMITPDADQSRQCPLLMTNAGPRPGMAWVPAGRFRYGDTVYPEELPVRETDVDGFWMDRTEVTNAQFNEFVAATGYVTVAERPVDTRKYPHLPVDMQLPGAVVFFMPNDIQGRGDLMQWWRYTPGASWRHPGGPASSIQGRDNYPVSAVTYADAQAYADWKGHSLPSEIQWEWAARGAQNIASSDVSKIAVAVKARTSGQQPIQANTWQGIFPVLNAATDGFTGLAPVGCYEANALGLFDLIGNVWELTADIYLPDHRSIVVQPPAVSRLRPIAAGRHVIKGGSFLCAPNYCMRYRAGSRQPQDDDLAASHLGFRTVFKP